MVDISAPSIRANIPAPLFLLPILMALGLNLQWSLSGSDLLPDNMSLADPIALLCSILLLAAVIWQRPSMQQIIRYWFAWLPICLLALLFLASYGSAFLSAQETGSASQPQITLTPALDRLFDMGGILIWFVAGLWIAQSLRTRGLQLFLQIFLICTIALGVANFMLPDILLRELLAPLADDEYQLLASSLVLIFAICYLHSLFWRTKSGWQARGSAAASFLLLGMLTLLNIPGLPLAICAMFLPMAFDSNGQMRKLYSASVLILAYMVSLTQDLPALEEIQAEAPVLTFSEIEKKLDDKPALPDPNEQPAETLVAAEMWLTAPWFGHGLGSAADMDISPFDGEGKGWEFKPNSLHIILVEFGLIGFAFFAIMGFLIFLKLHQASRQGGPRLTGDALLYRAMGMFLLAVLALSFYHDMLAQRLPWLVMGLMVGRSIWIHARRRTFADPASTRTAAQTSSLQRQLEKDTITGRSKIPQEQLTIRAADGRKPDAPDTPTIRPGKSLWRRR